MQNVMIVSPFRSPVTKAFRGSFKNKRPDNLLADVIRGMLKQTSSFDPELIEDVIVGCAMPEAEQGMNIARMALLLAGLPEGVPGVTINRFCSSGLQSIAQAADQIRSGAAECLIAAGTESMSMIPMMGHEVVGNRAVNDAHPEFYLGMGLTAENVAEQYKISREAQDQFAYDSHQKACNAIEKGLFKDGMLPISSEVRSLGKNAEPQVAEHVCETDEGPRPDTSLERLAKLRAVFKTGGSVTAGNSSQMSDGAAACLVVSEKFANKHHLEPIARMLSFAVKGVAPEIMGIGPVAAVPLALQKAGIKADQLDRIELNEAFASQSLAVIKDLGFDPARVNPTGGAIALGHPLGATGAILTSRLLHGMKRDKQKYGLVTMCIGTGMGAAGIFTTEV